MDDTIRTEVFTTAKGTRYRVRVSYDDFAGEPWDYCDGHGPVSGWTTRDKRAGELVLAVDGRMRRLYNSRDAIKIAKRDGWDAKPYEAGTKGEQAVRAVVADYNYLKAWCDDKWFYVILHVVLLDEDGEELDGYEDYLGGVEYGLGYHWEKEAANIAENLERSLEADTNRQLAWFRSTCAPCKVAEGVL